jgi:hypothetical protein
VTLLRHLPQCVNPGGRVAIVAFHSGEDRRVKKAFQAGLREGLCAAIAENVVRPTPEECRANPRASAAKLRWARRSSPPVLGIPPRPCRQVGDGGGGRSEHDDEIGERTHPGVRLPSS